ncbi:MAG: hypothetical protein MZV49_06885 [Rhodopseudomonas palustris]|nr:hypothetical protein [Rhodopseudomonas palustris]
MRGPVPLTSAIVVSIVLLEFLTPPAIRFFSAVPVNFIHVVAVGNRPAPRTCRLLRGGFVGSAVRDVLRSKGKWGRHGQ